MKIAWFCIPAHGHTNPTLGLVKELTNAGHEIFYFSFEQFRENIECGADQESSENLLRFTGIGCRLICKSEFRKFSAERKGFSPVHFKSIFTFISPVNADMSLTASEIMRN